jgi:hypothetical protein
MSLTKSKRITEKQRSLAYLASGKVSNLCKSLVIAVSKDECTQDQIEEFFRDMVVYITKATRELEAEGDKKANSGN